jgi:hypothetical protein
MFLPPLTMDRFDPLGGRLPPATSPFVSVTIKAECFPPGFRMDQRRRQRLESRD